jgi:hypothetical protein
MQPAVPRGGAVLLPGLVLAHDRPRYRGQPLAITLPALLECPLDAEYVDDATVSNDAMPTPDAFPLEPTPIDVSDEVLDDLRARLTRDGFDRGHDVIGR